MKNLKSLSLVLVLTVVFSSFALSAFAAAEDKVIISSIDDLGRLAGFKKTGTTAVEQITAEKNGNVLYLHSDSFANGAGTYNTPGYEAKYSFVPTNGGKLGGIDNWKDYKNLRIEFNIYIENANNGISFRTGRYASDGSAAGAPTSTGTQTDYSYVFAVGGESFSCSGNLWGYSYYTKKDSNTGVDSSISLKTWHNVVIEIGAGGENNAVKFYIDGNDVSDNIRVDKDKSLTSKTQIIENAMQIQDSSIGFGGSSNNRCVLVPNGKRGYPFGLKLSGLKMTATNTDYVPRTEGIYASELKSAKNSETGKIDTSAIVYNLTGEEKSVRLIIGYYDSEGNLVDVGIKTESIANVLVTNINHSFDKTLKQYTSAKAFVWTDSGIIPLSKSADVK